MTRTELIKSVNEIIQQVESGLPIPLEPIEVIISELGGNWSPLNDYLPYKNNDIKILMYLNALLMRNLLDTKIL